MRTYCSIIFNITGFVPWLGAEGLSADTAAQRGQPQKSHPSTHRCLSAFLGFSHSSPLYQYAQGQTQHLCPPVAKKQRGSPPTSSRTSTMQGEDASIFRMNLAVTQHL